MDDIQELDWDDIFVVLPNGQEKLKGAWEDEHTTPIMDPSLFDENTDLNVVSPDALMVLGAANRVKETTIDNIQVITVRVGPETWHTVAIDPWLDVVIPLFPSSTPESWITVHNTYVDMLSRAQQS